MDNQHKEAGDSFCKAAEMALKNDEKDDAANDFWTASKSYKKSHPERELVALLVCEVGGCGDGWRGSSEAIPYEWGASG